MNILLSFLYFKLSFLWQIEYPLYRIASLPSSLRWPDSHQCVTPALTYLTFSLCCPQGRFHVHNPVRVALMLANRLWRAAHIAGSCLALCRYAEDPRSLGFPAKSRAKCSSSMEMGAPWGHRGLGAQMSSLCCSPANTQGGDSSSQTLQVQPYRQHSSFCFSPKQVRGEPGS